MSTERNYKQVNDQSGPVWNPKVETIAEFNPEDKANNMIEGYLIDMKHDIGQNKSTIYKVHEVNADGTFGEIFSIWSNIVLAGALDNMQLGTFVCIEYLGLKAKKNMENTKFKLGTTHFHNWAVFTDDNALPYHDAKNGNKVATQPVEEKQSAPVSNNSRQSSPPTAAKSSRQAAPPKNESFDMDKLPF
jgi:hypothetical protein